MYTAEEFEAELYGKDAYQTLNNLWRMHEKCNLRGLRVVAGAIEDILKDNAIRYNLGGLQLDKNVNYNDMEESIYKEVSKLYSAYEKDMELEEERLAKERFYAENRAMTGLTHVTEENFLDVATVGKMLILSSNGRNLGTSRVISTFDGKEFKTSDRSLRTGKVKEVKSQDPYFKQVMHVIGHDFAKDNLVVSTKDNKLTLSFQSMRRLNIETSINMSNDLQAARTLLREMDKMNRNVMSTRRSMIQMISLLEQGSPKAKEAAANMFGVTDVAKQIECARNVKDELDQMQDELTRFSNNVTGIRKEVIEQAKKKSKAGPER